MVHDGSDGCPRCGLLLQKEAGGFLGAMSLNYLASVGVWLIVLGIWLAATVPDVPVAAMLVVSVVLLVAVPLWFYPRSKGIWAAIEFLVLRADPDYRPPVRRDPSRRAGVRQRALGRGVRTSCCRSLPSPARAGHVPVLDDLAVLQSGRCPPPRCPGRPERS